MGTDETLAEITREHDLGDHVMVSFDGQRIKLRDKLMGDTFFFSPATLFAFERYVKQLRETYENARKTKEIAEQIGAAIGAVKKD